MTDTAIWEEEERRGVAGGALAGQEQANPLLQPRLMGGPAHLLLGVWGCLFLFLVLKKKFPLNLQVIHVQCLAVWKTYKNHPEN